MSGAYFVEPMQPFHSAAGAFFNTFTTFQDISPQKPLVPAEVLDRPGAKIEVEAWGEFSCATGVTLSLGVFLGTAAVAWAGAAVTTGTSPTLWPFHIKWHGMTLTQGATGTLIGQGIVDIGTSLTASVGAFFPATAAARTVTVDTTTAKYCGVGAAWSASAAGNTIKTNLLTVMLMN
jgi:hypothetical protein